MERRGLTWPGWYGESGRRNANHFNDLDAVTSREFSRLMTSVNREGVLLPIKKNCWFQIVILAEAC